MPVPIGVERNLFSESSGGRSDQIFRVMKSDIVTDRLKLSSGTAGGVGAVPNTGNHACNYR